MSARSPSIFQKNRPFARAHTILWPNPSRERLSSQSGDLLTFFGPCSKVVGTGFHRCWLLLPASALRSNVPVDPAFGGGFLRGCEVAASALYPLQACLEPTYVIIILDPIANCRLRSYWKSMLYGMMPTTSFALE